MDKEWQYFVNPFLSPGLRSYKKAVKISTYTNAALAAHQADPFYAGQYALYHPLHQALVAAYSTWKSQGGSKKGATFLFYNLLHQLRGAKVNAWDAAVSVVYPKGSAEHVAIFPKRHRIFQKGTVDARISAVKSLSMALDGIAPLAATKADVDAFYTSISNARANQAGQKSNMTDDSHLMAKAVTNAMNGLYVFLCKGLANFSNNPSVLEPMFDLQTLRRPQQSDAFQQAGYHINLDPDAMEQAA